MEEGRTLLYTTQKGRACVRVHACVLTKTEGLRTEPCLWAPSCLSCLLDSELLVVLSNADTTIALVTHTRARA